MAGQETAMRQDKPVYYAPGATTSVFKVNMPTGVALASLEVEERKTYTELRELLAVQELRRAASDVKRTSELYILENQLINIRNRLVFDEDGMVGPAVCPIESHGHPYERGVLGENFERIDPTRMATDIQAVVRGADG